MRPLDSLPLTETLEIENGLSLVTRIKLDLSIYPANHSVTKPIDEWKVKHTLIDFLKTSLSVPIIVPEEDLQIRRVKDIKNRKRFDPLAHGTLLIRDLSIINGKSKKADGEDENDVKVLEKKFLDWRTYIIEKMDGIEVNIEGVKLKLGVSVPVCDDFEGMRKAWEEFYAFGNLG